MRRRADAVVRGSPARNLAEMLAQEQAGVMAQVWVGGGEGWCLSVIVSVGFSLGKGMGCGWVRV